MHVLALVSLLLTGPSGPVASDSSAAVISTDPYGVASDIVVFDPAGTSADSGRVVATIPHRAGAVLRGSASPVGTIAVVASTLPSQDASYDSTLWWLEPGQPPLAICERVMHASRPHFDRSGRLVVVRGFAGPPPKVVEGKIESLRIDELSLEVFDPATGTLRLVHALEGYMLFVAGSSDDETFVYRVWPGGADIVGVDLDTQNVRVIAPVLPFARDFSVDADGNLIFVQRDDDDAHAWSVEQLDTNTGDRHILHASRDMRMLPFVLDNRVGLRVPGRGLRWLGGDEVFQAFGEEPLSLVHVRAVDPSVRSGVGLVVGRGMPEAFVGDLSDGRVVMLPTDGRPEPIGFVPGGAW